MVTGETTTRLEDLRKYTITNVFSDKYFINGDVNNDGIDLSLSDPSTQVVYYIGGIKYVDIIFGTTIYSGFTSGTTLNIFSPQGLNTGNSITTNYYKDPVKIEISNNGKINDDVFIARQEISVFEKNYRLEFITNVNDLSTYAGGIYFKVINNT